MLNKIENNISNNKIVIKIFMKQLFWRIWGVSRQLSQRAAREP